MSAVIPAQSRLGDQVKPAASSKGQIIFDLESLVLDTRAGISSSLQFTVQALGLSPPPGELEQCAGLQPIPTILHRWIKDADATRQALATYQDHFESEGRFQTSTLPQASVLLETLAGIGWELQYLTHIGQTAAQRMLDTFAPQLPVHSIISTRRPGSGMMRPHLLSALLNDTALPRRQSLLLSDHPLELAAARDLQLPVLALGYGRAPAPVLAAYQPVGLSLSCTHVAQTLRFYCRASHAHTGH